MECGMKAKRQRQIKNKMDERGAIFQPLKTGRNGER